MKAVVLAHPGRGPEAWELVDLARPVPGPGQVLVRIRAASLNYRDLMIAKGLYGGPPKPQLVALSDGAGEIAELGPGVTGWRVGDRVASAYYPAWHDGIYRAHYEQVGLGIGGDDGVLAEYAVLAADGIVAVPASLSFEQAATLPCAAVTAWHALFEGATPLPPGASVLVQGTGGVSLFAAQLAVAAGQRVIATTSSDAKLDRLRALGITDAFSYRTEPAWHEEVLRRTSGEGVDLVIDVGGAPTLAQSFAAVKPGGRVALVGLLGGVGTTTDPLPVLFRGLTLDGVKVGSVAAFARMLRAFEQLRIEPVIDEVFDLAASPRALAKLATATHVGKLVVRVP